MFRTVGAVGYTDLETTGEHVQEVLRLHAEDSFVSEVLAHIALVDLFHLDVGESGVVEESVGTTQLASRGMRYEAYSLGSWALFLVGHVAR